MFYIGYIFAALLVASVCGLIVVAAADSVKEAHLNKQYLPDVVKGGNIAVSINGNNQKYYRVEEVTTCLNDPNKTKSQRYVKKLELHELTDEEISNDLLK